MQPCRGSRARWKFPPETASASAWRSRRSSSRREIALGFAESRLFPDSPVTAEDFTDAANLFLSMHDFDLAENYYTKAQLAGANNRSVAIGLTNTYLAEGDTRKA